MASSTTTKKRGRPPASSKIRYETQGIVANPLESTSHIEFDIYNISLMTKLFKYLSASAIGATEIILSCWEDEMYWRETNHFNDIVNVLKYNGSKMARYYCKDVIHLKINIEKLSVLDVKVTSFVCIRFFFRRSQLAPGSFELVLHMFQDLNSTPKENIIDEIDVIDSYRFGEKHGLFNINIYETELEDSVHNLVITTPLKYIKPFVEDKAHEQYGDRNPICTFTYEETSGDVVIQNFHLSKITLSNKNENTNISCNYNGIIAFTLYIKVIAKFLCSSATSAISDNDILTILYIKDAPSVTFKVSGAECTFSTHVLIKT